MVETAERQNLADLLEKIEGCASGGEIALADVKEAFGRRSFGPLLMIVGLLSVLPTGLIPGMGYATATLMIVLFAGVLFAMKEVWLPGFLMRRSIGKDRVEREVERLRPWAERIDRISRPRLEALLKPPLLQVVALAGIIMAATMYPLGPFPFGAFPGGGASILIGLALTTGDGLFALAGLGAGILGVLATAGAVSLL
jgi:hypothetical protein